MLFIQELHCKNHFPRDTVMTEDKCLLLMVFPLPLDSMPVLFPSFPFTSLLNLCPLFFPECWSVLLLLPDSLTYIPVFISPGRHQNPECVWLVCARHTHQIQFSSWVTTFWRTTLHVLDERSLSVGMHRVGHEWSDLAAPANTEIINIPRIFIGSSVHWF